MEIERDRDAPGPLLLATKFHAPLWHDGLVSRRRLVEALRRGSARKLTLISAPAGFGKTTLLAEWLAEDTGRSVGWLSLDRQDNDPARFWTYAIAALQTSEPTLGADSMALLHALQPPAIESILTSLINELAASTKSFALVLDDLHMIEQRAIHEGLGFLLDHLPPQLRLVATSRADPPLALSRLRALGALNELRAAELRFTPEEAGVFLNDVMKLRLSDDDVRSLDTRAEGWIAGLQLAALSIRDQEDASGFILAFAGDHRYIVDYLLEEVLHRQDEETRSFLLQTSILDRMTGSLCDAVTEQGEGAARLGMLEQGNFFLVPLDTTRGWYRYHHLFADVLRARLLAEFPDRVSILHLRASAWHEQQGSTAEAVGHALAAGAFDRAAGLVELDSREMQRHRQDATMLGWLDAMPPEEINRRPVLSAIYAGVLLSNGRMDEVDTWLRIAERWRDEIGDQNGALPDGMLVADPKELDRLAGTIAVYRSGLALATGDATSTMKHALTATAIIPDDDHLYRGAAAALQGLAHWTDGELESAYQAYAEGMLNLRQGGYIIDAIGGSNGLADLLIEQGRLYDALAIYESGLRLAAERGLHTPGGTADMYVGMCGLYREWNDLDAALQMFARSETLGETAGSPQYPHRWRVALARIRASLGDLEGASVLLEEAELHYASNMFPNSQPIPAMRARVWIAQGRIDEASAWAREGGISADDSVRYLSTYDHLTLARLLLAGGSDDEAREALGLLGRLRTAAERGRWTNRLIEALVLETLGNQRLGRFSAALRALERALQLSEDGGYVRRFVDEGVPMRQLLLDVAGSGGHRQAQRVLRLWGDPNRTNVTAEPMAGPVEMLTPREIEILRLIAAGLRNQEIADRLFISLPTVKRHVANAYGKLGVTHRTEAIARATEIGLL